MQTFVPTRASIPYLLRHPPFTPSLHRDRVFSPEGVVQFIKSSVVHSLINAVLGTNLLTWHLVVGLFSATSPGLFLRDWWCLLHQPTYVQEDQQAGIYDKCRNSISLFKLLSTHLTRYTRSSPTKLTLDLRRAFNTLIAPSEAQKRSPVIATSGYISITDCAEASTIKNHLLSPINDYHQN